MPFAVSIWSVLLRPDDAATWRNLRYKPDRGPVVPSVSQADYVKWDAYWWRYHPHWRKRGGAVRRAARRAACGGGGGGASAPDAAPERLAACGGPWLVLAGGAVPNSGQVAKQASASTAVQRR